MKKRIAASAFCFAFVCVGVIGAGKSGILKNTFTDTKKETTSAVASSVVSTEAAASSAEKPVTSEAPTVYEPLYYSKLVKNAQAPELDGYDGAVSYSGAGFDIDAFKESLVDDSVCMVEGEILDIWVNHYEYATASNKFEPNGLLYHKPTTVAYKIRVDRVFSGDFKVGDTVIVEDYYFVCDSVVSLKKGSSYVIPIGRGDGSFCEPDEIVSGDTALNSCYYTSYQFHPQIEKVSGGYLVTDDWKTLITDECTEVIIDVDNGELPFWNSMYYVPDSIFNDRISLILQS